MLTGLVGSVAGGLIGAGASIFGNIQDGENAREAAKAQFDYYRKQREFDYYYDKTVLDDIQKPYYLWQQEQDFNMARRYAQNSAKWTVEGYQNAGLNPLLAAQHGDLGSLMPSHTPNTASRSSNSVPAAVKANTHVSDIASAAIQGAHVLDQLERSELDNKVLRETADSTINSAKAESMLKAKDVEMADARINTAKAESLKVAAEAEKAIEEAKRAERTGGAGSNWYAEFGNQAGRLVEALGEIFKSTPSVASDINFLLDNANSAKSATEARKKSLESLSDKVELVKPYVDKPKNSEKSEERSIYDVPYYTPMLYGL